MEKTYISSFAYGNGENMAMWGLYSLPWEDAVRIGIPGVEMKEWISNADKIFLVNINVNNSFEYGRRISIKPVITDVAYVTGKDDNINYRIVRDRDTIRLTDEKTFSGINNLDKITGYIKNLAWSYENEVRLKVELEEMLANTIIAVKIPEGVLNNLELTAGPWITDNLSELVNERLIRKNCEYKFRKCNYSGFRRLVNLRNVCFFCNYTFEQRI